MAEESRPSYSLQTVKPVRYLTPENWEDLHQDFLYEEGVCENHEVNFKGVSQASPFVSRKQRVFTPESVECLIQDTFLCCIKGQQSKDDDPEREITYLSDSPLKWEPDQRYAKEVDADAGVQEKDSAHAMPVADTMDAPVLGRGPGLNPEDFERAYTSAGVWEKFVCDTSKIITNIPFIVEDTAIPMASEVKDAPEVQDRTQINIGSFNRNLSSFMKRVDSNNSRGIDTLQQQSNHVFTNTNLSIRNQRVLSNAQNWINTTKERSKFYFSLKQALENRNFKRALVLSRTGSVRQQGFLNEIKNLPQNINNASQSVVDISNVGQDTVAKIGLLTSRIDSNIDIMEKSTEDVKQTLYALPQQFLNFVQGRTDIPTTIIQDVIDILNIVTSWYSGAKQCITFPLMNMCLRHGIHAMVIDEFTRLINTPFTQQGTFEQPITMFLGLVALLSTKKMPNASTWSWINEKSKEFGHIDKSVKGIAMFTSHLMNICTKMLRAICERFLPDFAHFFYSDNRFDQWQDRVSELNKKRSDIKRDLGVCNDILATYDEGQMWSRSFKNHLTADERSNFNRQMTVLTQLFIEASTSPVLTSGTRPEPLTIMMLGEPATGKSSAIQAMSAALCVDKIQRGRDQGVEPFWARQYIQDPRRATYVRSVENEFWDGYTRQPIVVYDDFMQKRDLDADPNPEPLEIIRASNCSPWQLHMSAVKDKSDSWFTSSFIILNTNLSEIKPKGIVDINAFKRRIHILVRQSVKPEFRKKDNSQLDISKVLAHKENGGDPLDVYVFEILDSMTNTLKCTLGFHDFIAYCVKQSKDFDNLRGRSQEHFDDYVTSWISKLNQQGGISEKWHDAVEFIEEKIDFKRIAFRILEKFRNVYDWLVPWVKVCFKYLEMMQPVLALIAVAGYAIHSIFDVSQLIRGKQRSEHEFESKSNKDGRKSNQRVNHRDNHDYRGYIHESKSNKDGRKSNNRVSHREQKNERFYHETNFNPSLTALTDRLLMKSVVTVAEKTSTGWNKNIQLLCIKDNIYLAPRHFAQAVVLPKYCDKEYYLMTSVLNGENALKHRIYFKDEHVTVHYPWTKQDPNNDMAIMEFHDKSGFPRRPDIINHFINLEDLERCGDFHGVMLTTKVDPRTGLCYPAINSGEVTSMDVKMTDGSPVVKKPMESWNKGDNPEFLYRESLAYTWPTFAGDCGSPLIWNGQGGYSKIVGIHLLGGTIENYSSVITRDDLINKLQGLTFRPQSGFVDQDHYFVEQNYLKVDGDFIPCGRVLGGLCPPYVNPTKTTLAKSKMFEMVTPSIKKPAHLVPIGEVDPLLKGIAKAGGVVPYIPLEYRRKATEEWFTKFTFLTNKMNCLKTVLTNAEAIRGIPDLEGVEPINRQTSMGWPLAYTSGGSKKQIFLGKNEDWILDDPDIMEQIHIFEELAQNKILYPVVFNDALKDELRPNAKVDQGKTRVFSAGPMIYTIVFRKYFLSFCAAVQRTRIKNETAIGINPRSVEWLTLYNHLRSRGDEQFCGDFQNYDGTLNPNVLEDMFDAINNWYGDSEYNQNVRRALARQTFQATHISGWNVYRWTKGQPSGCPMTSILNSIVNSLMARICYYSLEKEMKEKIGCVIPFEQACSMISYGDDNVFNFQSWFYKNDLLRPFCDMYTTYGMTYTDAKKTGKPEATTIDNIDFLKRRFLHNDKYSHMMAPIDLYECLEILNWTKGSQTNENSVERIENCLDELVFHGKQVFEEWSKKIYIAADKCKLYVNRASYETRLLDFLKENSGFDSNTY